MWTPPINVSAELTQGALLLIHYSEGVSQWVQLCTWSPTILWRSNSIFNLWVYRNSMCRTSVCEGWYLPRLPENAYLWLGWGSLSLPMILAERIGGKGGGWSQTGPWAWFSFNIYGISQFCVQNYWMWGLVPAPAAWQCLPVAWLGLTQFNNDSSWGGGGGGAKRVLEPGFLSIFYGIS